MVYISDKNRTSLGIWLRPDLVPGAGLSVALVACCPQGGQRPFIPGPCLGCIAITSVPMSLSTGSRFAFDSRWTPAALLSCHLCCAFGLTRFVLPMSVYVYLLCPPQRKNKIVGSLTLPGYQLSWDYELSTRGVFLLYFFYFLLRDGHQTYAHTQSLISLTETLQTAARHSQSSQAPTGCEVHALLYRQSSENVNFPCSLAPGLGRSAGTTLAA